MTKKILLLVGPSASGKSTLGNFLKNDLKIPEIISHTTRKKREGEIDGIDYYFVSPEHFSKISKIENTTYAGNQYGISKEEIETKLTKNDIIFAITDIHGALKIKENYPNQTYILFIKCSFFHSIFRMKKRGDSFKTIFKRSKNFLLNKELSNEIFSDFIIHNHDIKQSKRELVEIINTIH